MKIDTVFVLDFFDGEKENSSGWRGGWKNTAFMLHGEYMVRFQVGDIVEVPGVGVCRVMFVDYGKRILEVNISGMTGAVLGDVIDSVVLVRRNAL